MKAIALVVLPLLLGGCSRREPTVNVPAARPDPPHTEVHRTYNLATLSIDQAQRLAGRRHTYHVRLTSLGTEAGDRVAYEVEGLAGALATVWLHRGREYNVGSDMLVEATLVVHKHAEDVSPAGEKFPGFTELRLADARVGVE
jgi:hypothetical protein